MDEGCNCFCLPVSILSRGFSGKYSQGSSRAPNGIRMSTIRVDAKVVMLGKESVGKTSLVERYVHNRFLHPYQNVSVSCSPLMSMSASNRGSAPVFAPPIKSCYFMLLPRGSFRWFVVILSQNTLRVNHRRRECLWRCHVRQKHFWV